MRGREITLWLDERWYDALSKHLKGKRWRSIWRMSLMKCATSFLQREYERISHELWAEQQAEKEAREAARRFAVFMSRRTAAPIIFWPRKILSCSRPPAVCAATSASRPTKRPTALSKRCCAPSGSPRRSSTLYVSERLDNTGRVVGAYDIDLDSGDMEAVSIMDGWKRFRIRDGEHRRLLRHEERQRCAG